jgi:transposase
MNLTDEQWRLIEPILPPPSPFDRGRPPLRYPPGMLRCASRSQSVGRLLVLRSLAIKENIRKLIEAITKESG